MKKLIILGAILFLATFGVTFGQTFYANLTSIGHNTYLISDMRVEGQDNYNLNTSSVTFEPMEDSDAMYSTCASGCFQETITLISNDDMEVVPELVIHIDGVRIDNDRFGIYMKENNMTINTIYLFEQQEKQVTFTVYLRDELTWEEQGKTLDLEIRFKAN